MCILTCLCVLYVLLVDAVSIDSRYNDQIPDMLLGFAPHSKSKGTVLYIVHVLKV